MITSARPEVDLNKPYQWIVGVLISAVAVLLAVRGVNLTDAARALQHADYRYVWPALALIFAGLVTRALSWRAILGPQVPFARAFAAMNEGYLLNNLLPFRLGELGRAYLISRNSDLTAARALSTVLVERLVDMAMIVAMLVFFVPLVAGLSWARGGAELSVVVTAGALVGLWLVARHRDVVVNLARRVPWLGSSLPHLGGFIDGLGALSEGRRVFWASFWSAGAWVSAGFSYWLLLKSFVPTATVAMGFFTLIIAALGAAVPSAPAYVGVFEAAVVAALGAFHVESSVALSYAVLLHALNFGLTCALGAAALSREGESLTHLAQAAQSLLSRAGREAGPPASAA
jgi:uncharacterized protein (TIRG00374 family)